MRDSSEFYDACESWTGALHQLQGDSLTPRALKRFKNRGRFYAMMRGREDGPPTALTDLSDSDLVALGAAEQAGLIPRGLPEASAWNLEGLSRLPIDPALREQMLRAISRIRMDEGGQRAFRKARDMVART